MRKLYSLFATIILIMASVAFVACQVNSDDAGGSIDNQPVEYTITVNAPHGTVEFDKTKAKAGETVKLTKCKADEDYNLKTMSIKKANGEDVLEDKQNQTFVMPDSNVTVDVIFEKSETPEHPPVVDKSDLKTDEGEGDNKGENNNPEVTPTPVDETTEEPKQGNTDPVEDTPQVDPATVADQTYGFVPNVDYEIYAPNGDIMMSTKGNVLIEAAKDLKFVKDTDYTINGKKVTLTASGMEKVQNNGGFPTSGGSSNDKTYSVDVLKANERFEKEKQPYYLAIPDYHDYKAGDKVEVLITNGSYNVSTGIWGTPPEDALILIDAVVGGLRNSDVIVEGWQISFTMPDFDVSLNVRLYDVECVESDENDYTLCIENSASKDYEVILTPKILLNGSVEMGYNPFSVQDYKNLEEISTELVSHHVTDYGSYYDVYYTYEGYLFRLCSNNQKTEKSYYKITVNGENLTDAGPSERAELRPGILLEGKIISASVYNSNFLDKTKHPNRDKDTISTSPSNTTIVNW